MSLLTLYLITVLPNLGAFFGALIFISLASIAVVTIALACLCDSYTLEGDRVAKERFLKWLHSLKYTLPLIAFLGFLAALTPTEKQLYTIAGGYAVTNVEGINKLPANIVGAANAYLEKVNKELGEVK